MNSGFSHKEGLAYDRWKTSLPDDEPYADCPVCGADGAANLGPHDCDEDCPRRCRRSSVHPCDDCEASCPACGEKGTAKRDGGDICLDCAEAGMVKCSYCNEWIEMGPCPCEEEK